MLNGFWIKWIPSSSTPWCTITSSAYPDRYITFMPGICSATFNRAVCPWYPEPPDQSVEGWKRLGCLRLFSGRQRRPLLPESCTRCWVKMSLFNSRICLLCASPFLVRIPRPFFHCSIAYVHIPDRRYFSGRSWVILLCNGAILNLFLIDTPDVSTSWFDSRLKLIVVSVNY